MPTDRFSGKVVLVTGGATGIGAATVSRFARLGADVACCYCKSHEAAQALAGHLAREGAAIHLVRADVADSAQVKAAVDSTEQRFGRPVSILVNNAGDVIRSMPIEEMDEAVWSLVLAVNLNGVFHGCKHCIPGMRRLGWGRIINLSSISARSGGGPGAAPYAASKAAVEAFTRALAKEVAPYHITANSVSPGVVDTPIHQRHNTPESLERLRLNIPLQRLGEPEEVASVIAFLATDDASYITGATVPVNGGLRLD